MNPIKNGRITSTFDEPRPLSNPGRHVHGALDIGGKVGTKIYAPCDGNIWGWFAIRHPGQKDADGKNCPKYWPTKPVVRGAPFLWANYFYDMYGGIIILEETDENKNVINTHLICHTYGNQLFNKVPLSDLCISYVEEKRSTRWPIHAFYTNKRFVSEGAHIGYVGNAGYSTGAHIHWEIHPGTTKVKHADRIRPTEYM